MWQVRAVAAAREPGERRVDALEGELERVRRDRSDLSQDLARAKAAIAASEQQVVHPTACSRLIGCTILRPSRQQISALRVMACRLIFEQT